MSYAILGNMKIHIAIDIGGTQMRAASFHSESLDPLMINRIKTHIPGKTPQQRLIEVIQSVWPDENQVDAIGIAIAGPIDLEEGIIEKSPNIPAFDDFQIVQFLEDRFGTQVLLGNDANLAALGEWRYGAGQNHNDLIYLTISTGIGSGIISDGRLLLGVRGMAAELGHIIIFPDGPKCSCGQYGHLEAVASGTAIAEWTKKQIENGKSSSLKGMKRIDARNIAKAAFEGDQLAVNAFSYAGKALGIAIVNFIIIFNPGCIIFGGGVSRSMDLLMPHIDQALKTKIFEPSYCQDLKLKTAALGDDVGLFGALVLAREKSV
jgi:glucokinase